MTGGILELVANGSSVQDIYLTKKPQITFWKMIYRRHTPFSTESIILQPEDRANFGQKAKFKIGNRADLAGMMYLVFEIPSLEAAFPKRSELLKQYGSTDIFEVIDGLDEEIEKATKREILLKELSVENVDKINKLLEIFPEYRLIYDLYHVPLLQRGYTFLPMDPSIQEQMYVEWLDQQNILNNKETMISQINFIKKWTDWPIIIYKPFLISDNVIQSYGTQYHTKSLDEHDLIVLSKIQAQIDKLFAIYPLENKYDWIDHRAYFWKRLIDMDLPERTFPTINLSRSDSDTWVLDFPVNLNQLSLFDLLQNNPILDEFLSAYDKLNIEPNLGSGISNLPLELIHIFCIDTIIYRNFYRHYHNQSVQIVRDENWSIFENRTTMLIYENDIDYDPPEEIKYFNKPPKILTSYEENTVPVKFTEATNLVENMQYLIDFKPSDILYKRFREKYKTANELEAEIREEIDSYLNLYDGNKEFLIVRNEILEAIKSDRLLELSYPFEWKRVRLDIIKTGILDEKLLAEVMGITFKSWLIGDYSSSKVINIEEEKFNTINTYEDLMKLRMDTLYDLILNGENVKKLKEKKEAVYDAFFHNRDARCAWIRKLGHFIAEQIQIQSNGQVLDLHVSDWFEILNNLTIEEGKISGYNKMIGNVPELIDFTTKKKPSSKIYLPLIFWPNKNPYSALPMINLIHSAIEIIVQLRPLEEVAYKERFSEWVIIPELKSITLWVDYFFLGEAERKTFLTNRFQYLIEELQTNTGFQVTDANSIPFYKIPTVNIVKRTLDDRGANALGVFYDDARAIETDQPDDNYKYPFYRVKWRENKWGIIMEKIKDGNIQNKMVKYQLFFNNCVKLLSFVIKIDKHRNPKLREFDDSYFFGEHQYSNYCLLPHFDLSTWKSYRDNYMELLMMSLMDWTNPKFGLYALLTEKSLRKRLMINEMVDLVSENFVLFRQALLNTFPLKVLSGELGNDRIVSLNELPRGNYDDYQDRILNKLLSLYQDGEFNPRLWIEMSDLDNFRKKEILSKLRIPKKVANRLITRYVVTLGNGIINYREQNEIIRRLVEKRIEILDDMIIDMHYELIKPNKCIDPLMKAYLMSNEHPFVEVNTDFIKWSDVASYQYAGHSTKCIYFHSWALDPFFVYPTGALNLSKLGDLRIVAHLDPSISDKNPATMDFFALGYNIWNVMSGLNGKLYPT